MKGKVAEAGVCSSPKTRPSLARDRTVCRFQTTPHHRSQYGKVPTAPGPRRAKGRQKRWRCEEGQGRSGFLPPLVGEAGTLFGWGFVAIRGQQQGRPLAQRRSIMREKLSMNDEASRRIRMRFILVPTRGDPEHSDAMARNSRTIVRGCGSYGRVRPKVSGGMDARHAQIVPGEIYRHILRRGI